jgi:hypothetical protein
MDDTPDSSLYSWKLSSPRCFVRISLAICSFCGHMSIVNVFLKILLPHRMMMCFWDAWFVHKMLGYVQFSNNSCCHTNFFHGNAGLLLFRSWNMSILWGFLKRMDHFSFFFQFFFQKKTSRLPLPSLRSHFKNPPLMQLLWWCTQVTYLRFDTK